MPIASELDVNRALRAERDVFGGKLLVADLDVEPMPPSGDTSEGACFPGADVVAVEEDLGARVAGNDVDGAKT